MPHLSVYSNMVYPNAYIVEDCDMEVTAQLHKQYEFVGVEEESEVEYLVTEGTTYEENIIKEVTEGIFLMKCTICREKLDTEHPESIYGKNPKTFRDAWMHSYCYKIALEDLKDLSSSKNYDNKYDEYITRFN